MSADAPMFAGHFPGDPIVPGAYLLGWMLAQANAQLKALGDPRVATEIARVKFLRPLRPDQSFICTWTTASAGLQFEIALAADGREAIASGLLRLGDRAANPEFST